MCENTKLSIELSDHLNDIGYNEDYVKLRTHMWDKILSGKLITLIDPSETHIAVGSRSEGIGIESDNDILVVDNDTFCTEDLDSVQCASNYKHVYLVDRTHAPPGYCCLITDFQFVEVDLHEVMSGEITGPASKPGDLLKYISRFKSRVKWIMTSVLSLIFTFGQDDVALVEHVFNFEYDMVYAIPCVLPGLITDWCQRKRQYDWPRRETIQHGSTLPVHLVRVGMKGHETENLQWRISFTLAETYLIRTLNNTHIKVYVCLKKIAKYYLKPLCKHITSYIIKNIVLWLAESQPTENFIPELFLARIEDGLHFLKTSIEKKSLKNYMIPERNMFLNKLENPEEIHKVLQKLKEILADSEGCLCNYIIEQTDTKVHKMNRKADRCMLLCYYSSTMDYLALLKPIYNQLMNTKSWFRVICYSLHFLCKFAISYVKTHGLTYPSSIELKYDISKPSKCRFVYKDKFAFYRMCLINLIRGVCFI